MSKLEDRKKERSVVRRIFTKSANDLENKLDTLIEITLETGISFKRLQDLYKNLVELDTLIKDFLLVDVDEELLQSELEGALEYKTRMLCIDVKYQEKAHSHIKPCSQAVLSDKKGSVTQLYDKLNAQLRALETLKVTKAISEFLDKEKLTHRKNLKNKMYKARSDGLHAVIRNNELFINGKKINLKDDSSNQIALTEIAPSPSLTQTNNDGVSEECNSFRDNRKHV
ncbi:hypothetical protein ACJJTC_010346 [Scirpophaga incertulas]